MAPATALAKLPPTLPRGVVGSVVLPVLGSMSPLSLLRAAWVMRPSQVSTPGTRSRRTKQPVVRAAGTVGALVSRRSRTELGAGRFRPGGLVASPARDGSAASAQLLCE